MSLIALHSEFLAYLDLERGCSPQTVRAYRDDFRLFLRFLEGGGVAPEVEAIQKPLVRQYVAWLRLRGLKASSIGRRLHSLRSFWKYLRENDYIERDPFLSIPTPKRERPLPVYLCAEECAALLSAARIQGSMHRARRDEAVLAVLIYAGLRRSELLDLRLGDLNLNEATLRVTCGKGRKSRVIPLTAEAVEALERWLELRPESDHDYLFSSRWGQRMSCNALIRALRRALRRAGIKKPGMSLHKLRHSFACLMLQGGCDLFSLSRLLGHTRLDTTAIYLHATVEDLRSAVAKHPLTIPKSTPEAASSARPHLHWSQASGSARTP